MRPEDVYLASVVVDDDDPYTTSISYAEDNAKRLSANVKTSGGISPCISGENHPKYMNLGR